MSAGLLPPHHVRGAHTASVVFLAGTKKYIAGWSRGQLVSLISWRSQVRILHPLPKLWSSPSVNRLVIGWREMFVKPVIHQRGEHWPPKLTAGSSGRAFYFGKKVDGANPSLRSKLKYYRTECRIGLHLVKIQKTYSFLVGDLLLKITANAVRITSDCPKVAMDRWYYPFRVTE